MVRLNLEYRERFGFPFVICVPMNDKEAIVRQLSERIGNAHAVERGRGIGETCPKFIKLQRVCPQIDMDIATVNALPYEDFVDIFGNVVEKCPIITAAVWSSRPFASLSALEAAIGEFIDALPESGKEGILRCHPDLAGRDLQGGTLTRESRQEQAGAGLDALDSKEASRMARLNREYKERFGFPFVICARMNDKEAIMRQLSERIGNEHAVERGRGIEEVKKICHLRLQGLLLPDKKNKL